jgi:acyl-coenzyme A synthetase/AMP-(fatty) acid ligase
MQYESAQKAGDNKIIMYKHLYDDANKIYNGLKQKLEIGESIASMKVHT